MIYNVFGGTSMLNLAQSIDYCALEAVLLTYLFTQFYVVCNIVVVSPVLRPCSISSSAFT